MKKWWTIGGAVLLAGWFGLKDTVYRISLQSNAPAVIDPLDYASVDSWAAFPDAMPPGAWETPWGVDVFLIGPPAGLSSGPGLVNARIEAHEEKYDAAITELSRGIAKGLPLYAPHYHSPSAVHNTGEYAAETALGLVSAFSTYLAEHNRDRAILLAVDERALPLADPILAQLTGDAIAERFAGRIIFGSNPSGAAPTACNPSLNSVCDQTVDMKAGGIPFGFLLPRLPGRISERSLIDPDGTAEAVAVQATQVSSWLDENGPKPAEPLGDFEEIEIAPVYAPDEVITD